MVSIQRTSIAEGDSAVAAQANRLGILREALGLSPSQMADRAGIDRTSWGRFESGKRPVTIDAILRLTTAYDCTADFILRGSFAGMPGDLRDRILRFLDK
ncbi:MAG: helix-turn-helix transcriptional regulator [Pseudomonadota bacterium]|nr:helix-turn-helix transcriptional regulator [Pseudomonadota bacterium]MEE3101236.1 helix-turn-helix transcriptional regulator [Pseudomonadota bacterium]